MRCALKYISIIMLQLSIGAVPIAKPIINLKWKKGIKAILHQIINKLAREEISTYAIRPAKRLARLQGKCPPKPLVHKATEKYVSSQG